MFCECYSVLVGDRCENATTILTASPRGVSLTSTPLPAVQVRPRLTGSDLRSLSHPSPPPLAPADSNRCEGHPYATMRATLTTADVAAALGCSTPTARRLAAEWARLTAAFGCTTAGAGCRCHAWPHTAVGTTTARGGRPGHAVDADQLAAHLEALRSLDALRGELAREAA